MAMPLIASDTKPVVLRGIPLAILPFAVVVATLWAFPVLWYQTAPQDSHFFWVTEQTNLVDWSFKEIPLGKAAEAILVGDQMVNGEFISSDSSRLVRVFSAKRYLKKENEIGLFSHTPDRCWTGAGWTIELVEPQCLEFTISGLKMLFERRLFVRGAQKELVYFGAMLGGKPLPYRLDHYLNWKVEAPVTLTERERLWSRIREWRLGSIAWKAFATRAAFRGPQHFFRISATVDGDDVAAADELLQRFLPQWLKPVDYQKELDEWRRAKRKGENIVDGK